MPLKCTFCCTSRVCHDIGPHLQLGPAGRNRPNLEVDASDAWVICSLLQSLLQLGDALWWCKPSTLLLRNITIQLQAKRVQLMLGRPMLAMCPPMECLIRLLYGSGDLPT